MNCRAPRLLTPALSEARLTERERQQSEIARLESELAERSGKIARMVAKTKKLRARLAESRREAKRAAKVGVTARLRSVAHEATAQQQKCEAARRELSEVRASQAQPVGGERGKSAQVALASRAFARR